MLFLNAEIKLPIMLHNKYIGSLLTVFRYVSQKNFIRWPQVRLKNITD